MRAEEGWDDFQGPGLVGGPDGPQHLELGGEVEAVAGFGLQGGGAAFEEPAGALAQALRQGLLGRAAHSLDRGQDAAALGGDGGIALALEAGFKILEAGAGEDGVGVAVHEARQHDPAARVEPAGSGSELVG